MRDYHMENGWNLSLWPQNGGKGLTSRDYKNIGFESTDKNTCILLMGLLKSLI